jgi:hypothetical protein
MRLSLRRRGVTKQTGENQLDVPGADDHGGGDANLVNIAYRADRRAATEHGRRRRRQKHEPGHLPTRQGEIF